MAIRSTAVARVAPKRAAATLRKHALGFPGTTEEFPWGHSAIKVKGKAFLFLSLEDGGLSLSTKLPSSRDMVLELPFAKPTGYGLGRSGWVTATFGPKDAVPVALLRLWIDESYLAIAPSSLRTTSASKSKSKPNARSKPKAKPKGPAKSKKPKRPSRWR